MKLLRPVRRDAFSLVEVVFALAIMSFCLIVLLALLPISLSTIKDASEETAGINVISTVVSDLKATPTADTSSPNYKLTLADAKPQTIYVDQAGKVASASVARYLVTVTLSSPTDQNTINGVASVSWPAQAAKPAATVESFFALNRS